MKINLISKIKVIKINNKNSGDMYKDW